MSGDVARFERELLDDAALCGRVLAEASTQEMAVLVERIEAFIKSYVVLPAGLHLVVTLWAAATWFADGFDCFPYLALVSPTKRCGKTRLQEVLELTVRDPWRGTTPSEAALFRFLHDGQPTLLLDEVEAISARKRSERSEALLAILNCGYRKGATVIRCMGEKQTPTKFKVYGPKAFAAIGRLPETLSDRSIMLSMQRKGPGDRTARFIFARARSESEPIRKALAAAVEAHRLQITAIYQNLPTLNFLTDREEELWQPLFAVGSLVCPDRLVELERAARRLSQGKAADDTDDSPALRLLADIRTLWPTQQAAIFTHELLAKLRKLETSPWNSELELSDRKLARMLRPFQISPRTVRIGQETAKGYVREELEAAWNRYVPASTAPEASHQSQGA